MADQEKLLRYLAKLPSEQYVAGKREYWSQQINMTVAELDEAVAKQRAKQAANSEVESTLIVLSMEDVEEKRVEWLWQEKIPLGAVSAYTGNPDTGKTTAYCDLAARVTTERDFPGAKFPSGVGGEVLMLCAEDDYSRVIKPRLVAAGADVKAVYFVEKVEIRQGARRDERMFALDQDLSKIEAELEGHPTYALIIIDPISSYFGKGNMNSKQDVRTIFNRLQAICEKYRVTILVVEHFNKRADVGAIHKLGGSVALVAATRAAFMFAKVPEQEGQYVMHFIKGNYAKKKTGLRFTVGDKESPTLMDPETRTPCRVPYIVWGGEDVTTADDLLRDEKHVAESKRGNKAIQFLRDYLTEEKETKVLEAEAQKHGISHGALYEVKDKLGIRAKQHHGKWWWSPPAKASGVAPQAPGQESQESGVAPPEEEIDF